MELRKYAYVLLTGLLLLAGGSVADAQQEAMKKVQSFTVDGVRVILSPADNQLVSVIVGLEGGLLTGETSNPELGEFTSDLITSSGSKQYDKDAFRKFLSETSTSIYGGGDYRGINYVMTSTRHHFDRAWDVLASLITEPLYDENEYRNIMQRRVAQVMRRWSQPDDQAQIIADSLLRMGHPILSRQSYREDVEAVTMDMMRDFQKRVSERSRMLVVIVGNVDATQVKEKVRKAFSGLPMGSYAPVEVAPIPPSSGPEVVVVDRPESPTDYVYGTFVGPTAKDPDYWAMYVGLSHLRNVLFEEVRTKRNLSYAPASWMRSTLGQGTGYLSVSSVLPDSAYSVMLTELKNMQEGKFEAHDLENSKQVFITGYYMRDMTNSGKANSLYYAERNSGGWQRAFSYDSINSVDKAAVQRAFRKYAHDMKVGIVGPADKVTSDKYLY